MRTVFAVMICIVMIFIAGNVDSAEKGPVETVLTGCEKEFETFCKDVTPGEGRLLACLYAHGDKLSGRCEYALYDAAAQLERVIAALTYVASECRDDLKKYCSGVRPGEGRILECMEKNRDSLSDRCRQAVQDVN